MNRHHTGSGRRTVIPPDWAAHHRGAADQTHLVTCSIRHPKAGTPGTFNATTGGYVGASTAAAHFTGPCRVTDVIRAKGLRVIASEEIPEAGYMLILAVGDAPEVTVDDIVTFPQVDDNGDPTLVGKTMAVDSIRRSSLSFERVLFCSENQS